MEKLQITIWANVEQAGTNETGKIVVKKGSFYYNNNKYTIENGIIYGANTAQFADDNHSTIM